MSSTCRITYLIIKVSLMLLTSSSTIIRIPFLSLLENEYRMQTIRSTDILFFVFHKFR